MNAADKLSIYELMSRAAYCFDERDLGTLEQCFTPDATMLVNITEGDQTFGPFEGREAIMGLLKGALDAQTDVRRHIISNFLFEKEGDEEAVCVSQVVLAATENGEIRLVTSGIYRDTVVKADGRWRIRDRQLKLELGF
jgi:hypothetical protein